MSNLIEFARKELKLNGAFDSEVYGGMIGEAVMELIEMFSNQGHSGMSASITRGLFKALASYEPLNPLTGEDNEWNFIGRDKFTAFPISEPDEVEQEIIDAINYKQPELLWQNKRCPHVFKEADGRAYDSNGKVFRLPDGGCYTNKDSHVYIEFPYTPIVEYVEVEE